MRVILFGVGMDMTGANILACRWGKHLRAQGHEVLLLPYGPATGPLREWTAQAGIQIIEDGEAYVDSRTVAICNTIAAADVVIKASAFGRCIWWIHEAEHGAARLGAEPDLRHAFTCASAVIFPAPHLVEDTYRSFLFGQPKEKMVVIANGVDVTPDPPASGPEPGPLTIAAIGRVCSSKRQGDLIRAAAALPDPKIRCEIIGRVIDLDAEARRLVEAHPDRLVLSGEIPHEETMQRLGQADVLVHPSSHEAFSLTTLEAGMRGKAMVLADLPVYQGIWRHGVNCLMHPVGDLALLSHLIDILARDPALRRRLGLAARATAMHYRSEAMLAQLDRVVDRVVALARAPL